MNRSMAAAPGMRARATNLRPMRLLQVLLAAAALLVIVPATQADEVLYQHNTFFQDVDAQTVDLTAPGAGSIDVSLTDIGWPTVLQSLSFTVSSDPTTLLAPRSSLVPDVFDVTGPEALYAHISAVAGSLGIPGLPNLGAFSLEITYSPATVPLPAAGWLLFSGLLMMVALRVLARRSAAAAAAMRLTPG